MLHILNKCRKVSRMSSETSLHAGKRAIYPKFGLFGFSRFHLLGVSYCTLGRSPAAYSKWNVSLHTRGRPFVSSLHFRALFQHAPLSKPRVKAFVKAHLLLFLRHVCIVMEILSKPVLCTGFCCNSSFMSLWKWVVLNRRKMAFNWK